MKQNTLPFLKTVDNYHLTIKKIVKREIEN